MIGTEFILFKIVVDTNVVISGIFFGGNPRKRSLKLLLPALLMHMPQQRSLMNTRES